MNDTPQGDGNKMKKQEFIQYVKIRMNDTPQGDGNFNFTFKAYPLFYKNE